MTEVCNECGRSVAWGSGHFVNRVPDLNDIETRREMGKAFPEGDYMCAECDECKDFDCETCPLVVKR
jgi:hypothetical protein